MYGLHWFRRDLRLHENPALDAALRYSAGRVVPLFILDDAILTHRLTGTARLAFLLESLHALAAALRERGSRLIVRRGDPQTILTTLARQHTIGIVTWNRDYTPYARRRDAAVAARLQADGVQLHVASDALIIEPEAIMSASGKPYTVYTPYARAWRAAVGRRAPSAQEPPPFAAIDDTIETIAIPQLADLGLTLGQGPLPPGGEAAGLQRLAVFTRPDGPIAGYHRQRDLPALSGTSQLSPYLHLGCVAPAAALRAAQQAATNPLADAGAAIWISELAWRDFYYQIMYHFPHVLRRAFRPQYDALAWENNEDLFAAWCAGRTGYPIVDAAMRQLRNEAWMHNRCRMIVASFLCKNLLIDWRWGEHYFMQQLVDGDRAANNGGWQWAAGTGTDAQPYFRIFNPTSQGEKFDPQGDYVRRYVPELRSVASRYIHQPWAMPPTEQQRVGVWIGKEYPLPIVDHGERRRAALELYRAVR